MDPWSARDERPYLREPRTAALLWVVFFLALAAAGGGVAYYFLQKRDFLGSAPVATSTPAADAKAPSAGATPEPPQAPEAAASAEPAKPLPSLENSDALMRETVSGLVGGWVSWSVKVAVSPSVSWPRLVVVGWMPRTSSSKTWTGRSTAATRPAACSVTVAAPLVESASSRPLTTTV